MTGFSPRTSVPFLANIIPPTFRIYSRAIWELDEGGPVCGRRSMRSPTPSQQQQQQQQHTRWFGNYKEMLGNYQTYERKLVVIIIMKASKGPIINLFNPLHIPTIYFLKNYFNIIISSTFLFRGRFLPWHTQTEMMQPISYLPTFNQCPTSSVAYQYYEIIQSWRYICRVYQRFSTANPDVAPTGPASSADVTCLRCTTVSFKLFVKIFLPRCNKNHDGETIPPIDILVGLKIYKIILGRISEVPERSRNTSVDDNLYHSLFNDVVPSAELN